MSRFMKDKFPDKKVVYNDYENYSERIRRIPETNIILKNNKLRVDKENYLCYNIYVK